jgi:hypothetical protein
METEADVSVRDTLAPWRVNGANDTFVKVEAGCDGWFAVQYHAGKNHPNVVIAILPNLLADPWMGNNTSSSRTGFLRSFEKRPLKTVPGGDNLRCRRLVPVLLPLPN